MTIAESHWRSRVSRKSPSWNEGHEKVRAAGSVPRSHNTRYVRGIDSDESKLNPRDYATAVLKVIGRVPAAHLSRSFSFSSCVSLNVAGLFPSADTRCARLERERKRKHDISIISTRDRAFLQEVQIIIIINNISRSVDFFRIYRIERWILFLSIVFWHIILALLIQTKAHDEN